MSDYSEKSKTTKVKPEIEITLTIVSNKEKEEAMSNYVEENIALFEVGFVAQFVHHTHNIKAKHLSNLCEKLGQQDATAFLLALIPFGSEKFHELVLTALGTDGFAHFFNSFDGSSEDCTIDGETFTICRTD